MDGPTPDAPDPGPTPRRSGSGSPTTPDRYRAYVVRRTGDGVTAGVETLDGSDLPDGDVTVAVTWSAVNYKDGMVTRPGNRVARISPLVPGVDLVGTVLDAPPGSVAPGSTVLVHGHDLGVAHHGGFAQVARVPAGWVVPLPDGISGRRAAILGTAGFTAALSVHALEAAGLRPGDGPVLVTGAAGGVGSMAVLLLGARGYEVAASTGRAAETAWLRSLGASHVIGREDLVVDPERTLGPERWAGAVDCVGGATLGAVLRTLRYGAAVAASGLTGGSSLETTVYPFIVRNVALLGIDSVRTPDDRRRAVWAEVAGYVPMDRLDAVVDGEVDLDHLTPVLEAILAGQVRGRVLVRPDAGV